MLLNTDQVFEKFQRHLKLAQFTREPKFNFIIDKKNYLSRR